MASGSESALGDDDTREYGFFGKERAYAAFRPSWSIGFAERSLTQAGFSQQDGEWRTAEARPPVVASMGAGTGADAAVFKRLGCDVVLVEPNAELLRYAEQNLSLIPRGSARFFEAPAVRSGIDEHTIDLIVCAQSIHTMKHVYSANHLTDAQRGSGTDTEEWTRQHWSRVLKHESSQVHVWYYNPDPDTPSTKVLHDILTAGSASYAASKTPFFEAEYFKPRHIQPWIEARSMTASARMPVDKVILRRDQVAEWLSSYSFAPTGDDFDAIVDQLLTDWFDRFEKDGRIDIPYVGCILSGPLRKTAFDMNDLHAPIGVTDPLLST